MADEAKQLLIKADATVLELQGVLTNLNIAGKNVRGGTVRLPEITDVVANETKDLPGFVQQTQTSMREFERLVEAMQRHWFLRKYLNKTNPPPAHSPAETIAPGKKPAKPFRSPKDSGQ